MVVGDYESYFENFYTPMQEAIEAADWHRSRTADAAMYLAPRISLAGYFLDPECPWGHVVRGSFQSWSATQGACMKDRTPSDGDLEKHLHASTGLFTSGADANGDMQGIRENYKSADLDNTTGGPDTPYRSYTALE